MGVSSLPDVLFAVRVKLRGSVIVIAFLLGKLRIVDVILLAMRYGVLFFVAKSATRFRPAFRLLNAFN